MAGTTMSTGVAAAALAVLLAALASPATAAGELPGSFRQVASGPFLPEASSLHGDQLVWVSPLLSGGADIMRTDLSTQETTTLTSVVSASSGLRVYGLAFDGRWVTWLDDRFGNIEAFAMDTESGSLRRLSSTPDNEAGITASGGRAAWTYQARVQVADLESGARWSPTPAGSHDGEPCLVGPTLWLSRADSQGTSSLVALDLASNRTQTSVLASQFSFGQRNPRCEGSLVAWESLQFYDATTGAGKSIRMVRWGDLRDGSSHNVTLIDQRYGKLLGFTAGHLAWFDVSQHGAVIGLHDVSANRTIELEGVAFAGISDQAVAVAREGAAGQWTIYAQRWDDEQGSKGIPATLAGPLALALLAMAGLRARARP